jgi:hypothetical protein
MFARNFKAVAAGARAVAAGALFSALAWGQPNLTTISDTLFNADGTRFDGLAQITWLSFDAANGTSIAQQTTTVRIVDGNLYVQLTPTTTATPAAEYSVLFESDGLIQFTETWNVPSSTTPLTIADVQTTDPLFPATTGGSAGGDPPIPESSVTGLVADLTARPVEGPGYTPSRAAVINSAGQIEGAVGSTTNCLHVDGSSAVCSFAINFVDAETPAGVLDGANTVFTLANIPSPSTSLHLYRNGVRLDTGVDYSLSGSTLTFLSTTPQPGDIFFGDYRH